jgi:hypothetical protein
LGNTQTLGIVTSFSGPVIQRTSGQNKQPIGLRAQTVRGSDLAAFAATNHAPI